jgi:hypothetical protein
MKKRLKILVSGIFLLLLTVSYGQGWQVSPGTNIIVETGTTLYLDAGGSVVLEDDLSSSPSLLEKGTVTFNGGGDLKVQQYLERGEWHIVSSPVNNEVIEAYLDMYLYSYDETTDAFTNLYQPLTIALNVGEGYHVWSVAASPDYVMLNGSSNKSDVNRTLTVTNATNHSGWNLLGNPFPCAIDWNGNTDWNLNNVSATMYLFDANAGNYKTWNYVTGMGTNGKTDGLIAATQGFWVRTSDTIGNQPSYSLTIPASQRVASASTDFYKGNGIEYNLLRINVQGEKYADECIIAFNSDATDGFDNKFDAYKLFTETSSPKIYTETANVKTAVNFMNSLENHKTVPVTFSPGTDGTFIMNISGIESFPYDLPVYLEDKKDNMFMDLRENTVYTFSGTITDDNNRFVIHFANPLGIDNPANISQMNSIHIYGQKNSIIVNIPFRFDGTIEVYNLLGKKVSEKDAYKGKNNLIVFDANGYYIVKVIGKEGIKTQKVYLR